MKKCRNINQLANKLSLIIAFFFIPIISNAQVSISGTVKDFQTSEVLAGAHVSLLNTDQTLATDKNGYFEFKEVKKGSYKLKVTFIGYTPTIIDVEAYKKKDLTILLKPGMLLQEEVIISAIRASEEQAATYTNIDRKKIQEENSGQDLPYLMRRTPSMVVGSDAGTGIGYTGMRIRGTDVTRINVTVNGIPMNDPESHAVFWVNMPDLASSIDNIQIQRGVGTSTNGQAAFGASINIQTSGKRSKAYAETTTNYGSFNTIKNSVSFGTGLINDKFTVDARLSKMNSDGFIDRAFADLKSFYVSGAYYGEKSILKLNIFSGTEHTYQAWNGVPKVKLENDNDGMIFLAMINGYDMEDTKNLLESDSRTYNSYLYENETDNYQQDHYQLTYTNQLGKQLLLNLAGHYTRGRGYYEQYKKDRDYSDYALDYPIVGNDTIFSTDLIQQKWLDNHFYGTTYSLNFDNDNTNVILGGSWNRYIGDHYGDVIWMQYAGNTAKNYQWYYNQGIKTDFNIYAKAIQQLGENFNLYGDVQYRMINYDIEGIHDDFKDLTQVQEFSFINPKAGARYQINNNQSVYASFAVANREPSRSTFRDADENEVPRPERLIDYEAGYEYRGAKINAVLNVFYMDYKDQLIMTGEINDVGAAIMTNAPESFRTGLELSFAYKPVSFFEMNTNMAYSVNKIKDFVAYVDDWDTWGVQREEELGDVDIAFSPNLILDNEFAFIPFKDFKVSLISKFVSDQYIDNTMNEDRKLDSYLVNDVRLAYTIHNVLFKEIQFSLALNNVLSEEYETNAWVYRYYMGGEHYVMDGYFPQAGFNFLSGVSFKF
jgi:iron complex outermembrane receptor protein